jgi:hypothetical protein
VAVLLGTETMMLEGVRARDEDDGGDAPQISEREMKCWR